MPTQEPQVRSHNFDEVALGYTEEIAIAEAQRCLNCKNQPCVNGCPVNINIPDFISKIKEEIGSNFPLITIMDQDGKPIQVPDIGEIERLLNKYKNCS